MGRNIFDGSIDVGVASIPVSESKIGVDAERVVIIITNTGATTLNLAIGQEAIVGRGIQLPPNAAFFQSKDAGYTPAQDRVHMIGSGAGGTIAIHEEVDR